MSSYTKANLKKLICLCNDDRMCPPHKVVSNPNTKRSCITETVCFTKRYRRMDDSKSEYLKYFCDDAFTNSIRENVIEYRDCRVNSSNHYDSMYVRDTSAEYCCDTGDFCNEFLNPKASVISNEAFDQRLPFYNKSIINNDDDNNDGSSVTSLNIIFISLLSVLLLIIFIILLVFMLKRKVKSNKLKLKVLIYIYIINKIFI